MYTEKGADRCAQRAAEGAGRAEEGLARGKGGIAKEGKGGSGEGERESLRGRSEGGMKHHGSNFRASPSDILSASGYHVFFNPKNKIANFLDWT